VLAVEPEVAVETPVGGRIGGSSDPHLPLPSSFVLQALLTVPPLVGLPCAIVAVLNATISTKLAKIIVHCFLIISPSQFDLNA
jgi:hypothetical protein